MPLGETQTTTQSEEVTKLVFRRMLAQNEAHDDYRIDVWSDSEFELHELTAKWDQPFLVNLGAPSGRFIGSSSVSPENIFGTAQFPAELELPMVYRAGSQIKLALANQYAGANTIEICLCGIRRYSR